MQAVQDDLSDIVSVTEDLLAFYESFVADRRTEISLQGIDPDKHPEIRSLEERLERLAGQFSSLTSQTDPRADATRKILSDFLHVIQSERDLIVASRRVYLRSSIVK